MSEDFRTFIEDVEKNEEGGFLRIKKEVDSRFESPAIVKKLELAGKVPLIIFENIKGKSIPVAINCNATRGRVARSLGIPREDLGKRILNAYNHPVAPVEVPDGPVQEIVLKGDDIDVTWLPAMVYHDTDAGPYITAGIVFAKDPETGVYNLSYNRLMVQGKDQLGIYMTVGKHLNTLYTKAEQLGKPLEIAISIGNHPSWCIGALAIGPYDEDELGIIGGLKGSPLEMVKCKTVDLMVPARAEIVLEGVIPPFVRETEGPFGEFTGYSLGKSESQVVNVTCMTHRRDPIYQDILGGQGREHLIMATIPMEANYLRAVRSSVPEVEAIRVPAPFTLFIKLKKTHEGQARQAMIAALNADIYLKHAIVVDHDIDINNLQQVLWAVATRFQASQDMFVIPKVRGSSLDPSAEQVGVTDKMGIDATAKPDLNNFAPKNKIPAEVMERIKLEDYI
jgi:2,5-furandicarboxylate decarboxylase 1